MTKIFSIFLLSLFSFLSGFGQRVNVEVTFMTQNVNDENSIYYRPMSKLKWNDFVGIPQNWGLVTAVTSSGIGYDYKYNKVDDLATLRVNVYCPFNKEKSWVVSEEKKTDYILNHEQRHFDISYINTLLFIKELKNANFTTKNYQSMVNSKYKESSDALNKMQKQYDAECRHGLDTVKQAEWNRFLDEKMQQLTQEVLIAAL
jgi:DNA-binding transcriptional MerR regulator